MLPLAHASGPLLNSRISEHKLNMSRMLRVNNTTLLCNCVDSHVLVKVSTPL